MARRASKSTKEPGKSRHSGRYPYEDWPAFKPVPSTEGCYWELDLAELTPEQRAELDRLDAERERRRIEFLASPLMRGRKVEVVDLRQFLPARAKALKRRGAIDDNISRRKLARLLVEESQRAKDAGLKIRVLSADYLKDVLERFNVWPVSIID
jgi:hypothetical protein